MTDIIASLAVVLLIGGMFGCFLYLAEKPKPKARGRKTNKLDCWL